VNEPLLSLGVVAAAWIVGVGVDLASCGWCGGACDPSVRKIALDVP